MSTIRKYVINKIIVAFIKTIKILKKSEDFKRMKIGILTLPLHTNYGGILQAYALQTVLERMGHNVVVFDTPNKVFMPPLWKLPLSLIKRTLLKCLGKGNRIFIEHYYNSINPIICQNIQPFIDNNIKRKEIRKFTDLKSKDYDAIVVGSDQVWRAIYFPMWGKKQSIQNAFLSFTQHWNIKRISYAASFGTDDWEYTEQQTADCRKLLQSFAAVSVRERPGVYLCQKYFHLKAIHVLDPTMLLSKDDYVSLYEKSKTPKSPGTLLNYVLDDTQELRFVVNKIAVLKQLIPFSVNNPFENDETKPLDSRVKQSVETWLRGFADADFVITDSFHACVFSIIFKKQFLVVGNKGRGMSRFTSLLKMFGLEDRLVVEKTDLENLAIIDYDAVYKKYDIFKQTSLEFLKYNLNS